MSRYYKVKKMAKQQPPDFAKGDKITAVYSGFGAMYQEGDTAVVVQYLGRDTYGQVYKVKHQDGRELTVIGRNWKRVDTAATPDTAPTGAWDWTRGMEAKRPRRRGGNTIR